MSGMLVRRSGRCGCCPAPERGVARRRDERAWQRWPHEYDEPLDEHRGALMGYGYYLLPDGREAGYTICADCDHPDCHAAIDRGLDYVCGRNPLGHKDDGEPGCGNYYCEDHMNDHDCPAPECGLFPADGGMSCELAEGHELPHRSEDGEFVTVERPLLTAVSGSTEES